MTAYRILDPIYRPQLTENGHYMLRFRYLKSAEDGFEEPVSLFRRVAWNLAQVERRFERSITEADVTACADRFFRMMTDGHFLPNAPTLLAAGRHLQQLFACFVLPLEDSIDSIFNTLRMAALVHSKGGGTGFSFSKIRGRGTPITTGGVSTGAVSWMELFDRETEVIKNGGTGWGANMGVLRCDHPDILEFVAAKSDGDLRNFNISVALTDGFVAAYEADSWYDLVDPRDGCVVGRILARQLLDEICWEAWHTGDPGLLFIDRINADNPTPLLGKIEATNPCGEAPLLPFEACCLGGINVAAFANKEGEDLDWTGLRQLAGNALHMMDNVIEASRFPLKEIDTAVRRTRKVGIGVMGFADLLIARGIPYDSAEAEALAGRLMATIQSATREMSMHLAMERGPFPAYDGSRWQQSGGPPLRNATVTSNAPNSTISVIAGCSPGIEPLFSLAYIKQLANGEQLREVNPALIGALREHELLNPHLLAKIESAGSIKSMTELPANLRRIFVTAYDIAPATHVRIQAAFQKYTDLGVSKTINLPQDATVDNVKDAFLLAYALGCKGITCYRDGCQETQFLTTMSGQSKHDKAAQCPECAIGG